MVNILEASSLHTSEIREIAENSWWPAYGEILSEAQIRYMLDKLYNEDTIKQQLVSGSQHYLLVCEEKKAVGFASFAPREENPEVFKLHKLYCLPQTQGKGYGKLLLKAVEKAVLGAGKHTLELNVNRHNKAKGFYERMGFSVAYEEDVPIGEFWMNDYVMRKQL